MWILETMLSEEFYPPMRIAWEEFFECLKTMTAKYNKQTME